LFFENRAVYEITCRNIVQPDRPQMTIRHMCSACWITKATTAYSEYVILNAFPPLQWMHEHTSMLHHTYVARLIVYFNTTPYNSTSYAKVLSKGSSGCRPHWRPKNRTDMLQSFTITSRVCSTRHNLRRLCHACYRTHTCDTHTLTSSTYRLSVSYSCIIRHAAAGNN
jgi:hypothetical protein